MYSRIKPLKKKKPMTTNEFDSIKWRSGMKIAVDNVQTDIISVDFHTRKIAIEEDNELFWISSDLITLKK